MDRDQASYVATVLFTAAGRKVGEPEFDVWAAGLRSTPPDHAEDVLAYLLASTDWSTRNGPPTPASYNLGRSEWHREQSRARPEQRTLDVPVPLDGAANVRRLKELLASTEVVKRVEPAPTPEPPRPVRERLTVCPHEDHSQCGSGPIRSDPPEER